MTILNRCAAVMIYVAHTGYGMLMLGVMVFGLTLIPWTAALAVSPLILAAVLLWGYIARIAFRVAHDLWAGGESPRNSRRGHA